MTFQSYLISIIVRDTQVDAIKKTSYYLKNITLLPNKKIPKVVPIKIKIKNKAKKVLIKLKKKEDP